MQEDTLRVSDIVGGFDRTHNMAVVNVDLNSTQIPTVQLQ